MAAEAAADRKPAATGRRSFLYFACTAALTMGLLPLLLAAVGAPAAAARATGLLAFTLTSWAMEAVPMPLTSLSVVVLAPLLGLVSFEDSLEGFGQSAVWMMVATFVISHAMEETGLGGRISLALLEQAGGKQVRVVGALLFATVFLGFLVPASTGRGALLLPIAASLIEAVRRRSPGSAPAFGRALMLGLTYMAQMTSWSLLTGSVSSVYMVSFAQKFLGYDWTFGTWLMLLYPIALVFAGILWVLLIGLYPGAAGEPGAGADAPNRRPPLAHREWSLLVVLVTAVLGWITEGLHGLSVALVAMLAAVLICLPGVGAVTWKSASRAVKWDFVLLFGAGFTLALTLQSTGAAVWLARLIASLLGAPTPAVAAAVIIVAMSTIRLGFANMVGMTSAMLPLATELAGLWQIDPLWLCTITLVAASFGFIFPMQSNVSTMAFGYGYLDQRDFFRAGTPALLIMAGLLWVAALFYWPLLGIHP